GPEQVFGRETDGLTLALVRLTMAEIDDADVRVGRRREDALLERTGLGDEDGPPRLVARQQLAVRLRQAGGVEQAAGAAPDLLVVQRHVGSELGMQPDLLLGERQWRGVEAPTRDDDRRRAGGPTICSARVGAVRYARARERAHSGVLPTVTGSRSSPRRARFCRQTSGPGSGPICEKRRSSAPN